MKQNPVLLETTMIEDFGIIYIRGDGFIESIGGISSSVEKISDKKATDLVGKNFLQEFPPVENQIRQHLEELIELKTPFKYAFDVNLKIKKESEIFLAVYIFSDSNLGLNKICAILTPRFASKMSKTGLALSKAYNQLKYAERIAHLGHWDWDLVNDNLIWSEEMCRIMGYSPFNFSPSYNHLLDVVHEEDRILLKNNVKKTLEGQGNYQVETRIVRPDGTTRYLQTQGEATFSEDGRPVRMFGTSLDITERKLAELEIRKLNSSLEKRLVERQIILDNVSDGLLYINKWAKLVFINRVAEKIYGVDDRKGVIGEDINKIGLGSNEIKNCLLGLSYSEKRVDFIVNNHRYQYLVTGRPIRDVQGTIIGAIEIMTDIEVVTSMVRAVADPRYTAFGTIIGQSPGIRDTIAKAQLIAKTDYLVLLNGESGTGKDLFANSIHIESGRKGLFIPINCAALPVDLLEAELFGYNRGAFTGAEKSGKPGLFESAQDGTIFLDEIAEMPLALQAKLLRVIQENKIRRIGGKGEIRVSNSRFNGATISK